MFRRSRESKEDKERQQASIVLVKQSVARYDVGRFDETLSLLERAYDLCPHVAILHNLGQVYRVKKDYTRALFQYRAFLRACKPDDPNRKAAEYFAARMEALVQHQAETAKPPPPGAVKLAISPGEARASSVALELGPTWIGVSGRF